MRTAFLALLMAPLTASIAFADTWEVYEGTSHHCYVEYPSGIFMPGTVDDHDFQTFANADGDVTLRLASRTNEGNWTPAEIKAEFLKETGDKLVYDRLKEDYIVLSGYKGDNIFYSKIALSTDKKSLCIMHLSYPATDKLKFDGIVTRMSRSLYAQGNQG